MGCINPTSIWEVNLVKKKLRMKYKHRGVQFYPKKITPLVFIIMRIVGAPDSCNPVPNSRMIWCCEFVHMTQHWDSLGFWPLGVVFSISARHNSKTCAVNSFSCWNASMPRTRTNVHIVPGRCFYPRRAHVFRDSLCFVSRYLPTLETEKKKETSHKSENQSIA